MKWFLFFLSMLYFSLALAADQGAAKAIIVKGKVQATVEGKVVPVKKGMWLPEGATIQTAKKSFTKLLFIDKSSMNIGPESKMKIDSFPKKDAGIITLIKGQIRSKVTKNYMEIKKKDKSKLFIKTETAAMGVRGTDFIVSFNPVNKATSLITFEGAVAMAALPKNLGPTSGQGALERVVSSPTAVIVKKGQYSGANGKTNRATLPVKVSPVQIETLEKNDVPGITTTENKAGGKEKAKPAKKFKSIVPPGVDPTSIANESSEVSKAVGDVVGSKKMKKVEVEVKREAANFATAAAPEGVSNAATGEYAPKAGGIIDLKSASYIPPPEDAAFDANAGVYVMPAEMGYVDPETGDYKNDHYQMNDQGQFVAIAPEPTAANEKPEDGGRSPASAEGADGSDGGSERDAGDPTIATNTDGGGNDEGGAGDNPPPPPPPTIADASRDLAGDMPDGLPPGPGTGGPGNNNNNNPGEFLPNLPPVIPPPPLPPGPPPGVNGKTRARFNISAP